jgi:hypothetical protein
MTIVVEFPPGDPGSPPHRHPGPAFGYVLEGEMLVGLGGEPPRVVKAGEAFREPGRPMTTGRRAPSATDPRPATGTPADGNPAPMYSNIGLRTGAGRCC